MPLQVLDGPLIRAGESLSDGIDCSAGDIVRITFPQEFTDANVTFQVSSDGNFYNDFYDAEGDEITVAAVPNSGCFIDEKWGRAVGWLKIRSGTRDNPVEQTADCRLAVAIWTNA